MYLRGLRCRSSILSKERAWTFARLTAVRFLTTSHRLEQGQKSDAKPEQSGHGSQQKTARGSIRPLTVFALCIPLGYSVNWALKRREEAALIEPDGFVKYTLANKSAVSSTCSIFTLKPATQSTLRPDEPSLKRVITSVQFKQPQLQIARNYTLLPLKDGQDPRELCFLIRKERNGEVSGYLHRLPIGSEIELRGLSAEYVLPDNVDTVLFLAGGTGIAPAMQVADALAGKARVHILWASRKREDCVGGISDTLKEKVRNGLLSGWWASWDSSASRDANVGAIVHHSHTMSAIISQLDLIQQRSSSTASASGLNGAKLSVDYYVDEEGAFIQLKEVQRLLQKVGNASSTDADSPKKLLFVAGPEGFVNHWAAAKQWIGGREVQGPLGGALSTLDLRGWEVVKL